MSMHMPRWFRAAVSKGFGVEITRNTWDRHLVAGYDASPRRSGTDLQ